MTHQGVKPRSQRDGGLPPNRHQDIILNYVDICTISFAKRRSFCPGLIVLTVNHNEHRIYNKMSVGMDKILTESKRYWTCKRKKINTEMIIALQENLDLDSQSPCTYSSIL